MNFFVTGATGFLGQYMLEELLKFGHNIKANYRRNKDIKKKNEGINWIKRDILEIDQKDLKETDILINLASAGVSPKKTTLEEAININILSASRLLKIGNIAGIKRFVYAGTCHEYGHTANSFEKIPPNAALNPLSFYGSTKASGFHLINHLSIELKLELVYARIFSAYGPGQNKYNFWPMLREAALSGNDFKMSSGKQVRDFIPAQLVAKHLLNASQRDDIIKGQPFLINIGTGNPISLGDFAKKEWKRLGAKGKLMIGALSDKKNEPMNFCPDISNLNYKEI